MIINPRSWHYRIVLTWNNNREYCVPRNLCPYVRQLSAAIGVFALMGAIVLFLTVSTLAAWAAFALGWDVSEDSPYHVVYVIGGSITAIIIMIMIWAVFYWSVQGVKVSYHRARSAIDSTHKPKAPSEPSLIVEYFKAQHDKICPRLTFKSKD